MENIDITLIIEIVVTLIGMVITSFLIPYLKSKLTTNQFAYLEGIVKTAVYAAEVMVKGQGKGDEKRNYVINYVKSVCEEHGITYDANQVRQILEKSWLELSQEVTINEEAED